ncbi:MerR family transcriptional regulator [Couchioplanes azureus]|uniref:MerR family transcriptional regulator n=1 Tax=Couchioplanes caeruleus TaxID=56438 RepID=UPI0016700894|nr:MerR family transcriptional regulator [Couchioplanes caeruleus]GGQ56845.1 MerR family transcriptional regulator [Couchioplanes caeruleus subsp. azureus]
MNARDLGSLTIGEFGRRAGLSVKALRLYDVSGLLPPAAVDPVSGYRRYAVGQLDRARRISLLRQLGMPLAVVAQVLSGADEQAAERLDRWWAGQEQDMQVRRGTMSWLREHLRAPAAPGPGPAVGHRDVPATKVAAIRCDTDQQGLLAAIRRGVDELAGHLDAAGARRTGRHWVIYHGFVTPDNEAPIEVCVPYAGACEPAGEIVIRVEPAHSEAYVTVSRDDCCYPRILQAYAALDAHVAERSLITTAAPREVYLAGWHDVAGTDPFVLVCQPVAGA